ncbi:MAG: DMT family transporter [Chloroflexota bacterium]
MSRSVAVGVALTVISAFAFGSGALFAKPVYAADVSWHVLMAWRFLIGAILAWCWVAVRPGSRRALASMDRRAMLVAVLLGVLYTGNSGTYFAALETVSASLGALIVYVYPALVAVLSLRVGRRLEGRRAWGALGLATVGVVLAVGAIEATTMPPLSGLLLMLASPVIYSVWIVLSARFTGERGGAVGRDARAGVDPIAAGAVILSATAATYWLSAVAAGRHVLPAEVPAAAWGGIVGVGAVSTFVAVLAFYGGTHRIGAARASLVSTVEPIWTIVLAGLLFGESLTPLQLVGGAMILTGVVIAQTRGGGQEATVAGPSLRIADE